jgi:hypothetical protein
MSKKIATTTPAVANPLPAHAVADVPPGAAVMRGRNGAATIALIENAGNHFAKAGGSKIPSFNSTIVRHVLNGVRLPKGEIDDPERLVAAVCAGLAAFRPADEIEGMLAAQAMAMHFGAMECFRRSIVQDQPADTASKLRRDGANLARGMTDMLEALDRKRGKGPQVVRVERVVVHEGGQAIVGNVQPRGGPMAGEG